MYIPLLILFLLTPQHSETVKVQCVVVNLAPEPRLVCNDKDETELVIPSAEWPASWYPAFLSGVYNAEMRNGELVEVETKEPGGQSARIRARSLSEQRRWRRHALQQEGIQK